MARTSWFSNRLLLVFFVFEHETQHLWILAPYTLMVVLWHICNIPQGFRSVKFVIVSLFFVTQQHLWNITIQRKVACHNIWANTRFSDSSPLGENHCETGLLIWCTEFSDYCLNLSAVYRVWKGKGTKNSITMSRDIKRPCQTITPIKCGFNDFRNTLLNHLKQNIEVLFEWSRF